jgi:penicillin V acylase-like amidase (Ntn superfamily)
MLAVFLALALGGASGCSNWLMPHKTGLSGRTTDLGSFPGLAFALRSFPQNQSAAGTQLLPHGRGVYGYLGVVPDLGVSVSPMVTAGINEKGLTCDMQTLITTEMPPPCAPDPDPAPPPPARARTTTVSWGSCVCAGSTAHR